MIDLHTHTTYSRHATPSIEESVVEAINKDVNILAITDHAPLSFDQENRLQESELQEYIDKIKELQKKYYERILVLAGLEADFFEEDFEYIKNVIPKHDLDYVIGSIHFIRHNNAIIKVWEYGGIDKNIFAKKYFDALEKMICTGIYDSIGHPEYIYLWEVEDALIYDYFKKLTPYIKKYNMSYEINISLLKKMMVFKNNSKIEQNINIRIIELLASAGVPFVLGSDAHQKEKIGEYTDIIYNLLKNNNVNLVYYRNRTKYICN